MIQTDFRRFHRSIVTAALIWMGVVFGIPGTSYSHGGKTHTDDPFSAFEAVQKASSLYERLIVSGKLAEAWETGLSSIHVFTRGSGETRETVVQFKRADGDSPSVYFFFDRQGAYSGSNFTGQ